MFWIVILLILILIAVLYSTDKGENILVSFVGKIIVIPILLLGVILNFFKKDKEKKGTNQSTSLESDFLKQDEKDDEKSVVITCGSCGNKTRQNKNQGVIKIKCSQCQRESTVNT